MDEIIMRGNRLNAILRAHKYILLICLFSWAVLMPALSLAQYKESGMIKGARSGNIGTMERSYIEGTSPNERSFDGDPAILIGTEAGHVDVVRYLIFRGARVDDRGTHQRTALTVAAAYGNVEIMEHLLDAGADPDRTGTRKEVPIIIAARAGHLEAVKLLIKKGAYLDDTDLTGRTALDWARQGRNPRLIQLLENAEQQ
ncbi:MAG: ankyrin repeat domain-containing protein [Alphaproteobacteria bacterium]|nr:ankyrin repeat domain-containing protein [Alphaproteobacteria bacterium]